MSATVRGGGVIKEGDYSYYLNEVGGRISAKSLIKKFEAL